jgi:hypothetical protein
MDALKRLTISFRQLPWRHGLLAFCVVAILPQLGCDDFFHMEGHLYQCETKVPIPEAEGSAGHEGHKAVKFTTDNNGRFGFTVIDGPGATVRVSFVKKGFAPFSQLFEGEPPNALKVELCMEPVAQP